MKTKILLLMAAVLLAACSTPGRIRAVRDISDPVRPQMNFDADLEEDPLAGYTEEEIDSGRYDEQPLPTVRPATPRPMPTQGPGCIDLAAARNIQAGDYLCVTGTIDTVTTEWRSYDKRVRGGEVVTKYEPSGWETYLVSGDGTHRVVIRGPFYVPRTGCQALNGYFENDNGTWHFVYDRYAPCETVQRADQPPPAAVGCPYGCEAPSPNCQIKGNISITTHERIYHMPGQKWYSETRISPEYGEAWFCTEAEAQANGFRRSYE